MTSYRYCTQYEATLEATKSELTLQGISPERLHVYVRDNIEKRYDGLLLQCEHTRDRSSTVNFIRSGFFLSLFVGSAAYYYSQFSTVAGLILLLLLIPMLMERFFDWLADHKRFSKIYFLIVDFDDDQTPVVDSVVSHYPDLLRQA